MMIITNCALQTSVDPELRHYLGSIYLWTEAKQLDPITKLQIIQIVKEVRDFDFFV